MKSSFDKIKYVISQKSNISDIYCHNYIRIWINQDNNLHLEKSLNI